MTLSRTQLEQTLSKLKRRASIKPGTDCPDEETLAAYLDGVLNADEKEMVLKHLLTCGYCRHVAVSVAVELDQGLAADNAANDSEAIFATELDAMEKELGLEPLQETVRPPIMVVDDDTIYLKSLVHTLSEEFRVTACADGFDALERIDEDIQVVVLDIKMARMNGLMVAEKLKALHENIPIIFNTGYPGTYVRSDIEGRYRPFGYVTKDEPGELLTFIRWAAGGVCRLPA